MDEPADPPARFAAAMAAFEARDYMAAQAGFLALAEAAPGSVDSWVFAIRSLVHAGRLVPAREIAVPALAACPGNAALMVEAADLAHRVGALEEALDLCAAVRALAPASPDAAVITMRALRAAGRADEVAAVLAWAEAAGVRHPGLLIEAAVTAEALGDPAQTLALADRLRAEYPALAEGYLIGARAAFAQGEDGAALLEAAPDRVREGLEAARMLCWAAFRQRDAASFLARCAEAVARFPGDQEVHGLMAMALRQSGGDAEAFAAAHMDRFASEPRLFVEHAIAAETRGDRAVAAARWRVVRERFAQMADGYANEARVRMALGEFEAAEAVAAEGFARFADDLAVLRQYALVATRRQDWAEAFRRWGIVQTRFPGREEVLEGLGNARMALAMARIDTPDAPVLPPAAADVSPELRDFFMGFESLGDNCEFGIVQRHFGAEPLGLLRWVTIGPEELIRLLETRLEGIGEKEFTFTAPGHLHDLMAGDLRYFNMHTFVPNHAMSAEKFLPVIMRRLRFLREKFLDDLADGEKIFVYKQRDGRLGLPAAQRIHRAMRAIGEARLLCVMKPPAGAEDLTVREVEDGLFLGHLDALQEVPQRAIEYLAGWEEICRKVK